MLQYRCIDLKTRTGSTLKVVRPYIIDLSSTNGTFVNGERIESQRYFQLKHNDIITFGESSREYVFLQEEAAKRESGLGAE